MLFTSISEIKIIVIAKKFLKVSKHALIIVLLFICSVYLIGKFISTPAHKYAPHHARTHACTLTRAHAHAHAHAHARARVDKTILPYFSETRHSSSVLFADYLPYTSSMNISLKTPGKIFMKRKYFICMCVYIMIRLSRCVYYVIVR